MGLELEKVCKINDLIVGERYSLSRFADSRFWFIVTKITGSIVEITYGDGMQGMIIFTAVFYEFKFSTLEKELL